MSPEPTSNAPVNPVPRYMYRELALSTAVRLVQEAEQILRDPKQYGDTVFNMTVLADTWVNIANAIRPHDRITTD